MVSLPGGLKGFATDRPERVFKLELIDWNKDTSVMPSQWAMG